MKEEKNKAQVAVWGSKIVIVMFRFNVQARCMWFAHGFAMGVVLDTHLLEVLVRELVQGCSVHGVLLEGPPVEGQSDIIKAEGAWGPRWNEKNAKRMHCIAEFHENVHLTQRECNQKDVRV
jgi:hypothetical protein